MVSQRRPTRQRRWGAATAVALSAITIGSIATVGFGTAGASEFEPKPTGSATAGCEGGPAFHVELGNVHGTDAATFGITIVDKTAGGSPDHVDEVLVSGDSGTFDFPQQDGHTVHILVYSGQAIFADMDHTFDCTQPLVGTYELDCTSHTAAVVWPIVENTDTVGHDITVTYPSGDTSVYAPLPPGLTTSLGEFVDEGQHVTGTILDGNDVIATLDAVVDCQDPTATIVLDCSSGSPVLDFRFVEEHPNLSTFIATLDGVDDAPVLVGNHYDTGIYETSKPLTEDAPFSASVTDGDLHVTLAELSGVADCAQPETPTTTSTIPTTVPAPVPDPIPAATPADVVLAPSAPAVAATPVAVTPHFTG